MRLRAINIYSSFLGDSNKTRERTGFLRQESDFLDYEFYKRVKYINNDYCKQLNIACNENINGIIIGKPDFDGYPRIEIPFNINDYSMKSCYEKGLYWIKALREIFSTLITQYEFDKEKTEYFLSYLEEKYSEINMYEKIKKDIQQ